MILTASPQDIGAWLAAEARLGKTGPTCTGDAPAHPRCSRASARRPGSFYTSAVYPDPTWTGYPMLVQFRQQAAAEAATGDSSASLAPGNNTSRGSRRMAGCAGGHPGGRENDRRDHTSDPPHRAEPHHGYVRGRQSGAAAARLRQAEPQPDVLPPVQHNDVLEEVGPGDEGVRRCIGRPAGQR